MLNCLNILQPSSDSEHICAVHYMLYMNIHVYIINVFSTSHISKYLSNTALAQTPLSFAKEF